MIQTFIYRLFIFILLLFVLTFGGAAFAQTPATAEIVPSQHLTLIEAEKISGQPLRLAGENSGSPAGVGNERAVVYFGTKTKLMVSARFQGFKSGKNAKAMFNAMRMLNEAIEMEVDDPSQTTVKTAVENIGDAARLNIGGDTKIINVLKNNIIFELSVTGEIGNDFSLNELKRVAKQIADKL